jgi:predicted lipid-binding transport protein (Tim44 family)
MDSKLRSGARGKGEKVETRFVTIEKSDITAVELRGRTAPCVRFVYQLILVTRDKSEM